MTFYKYLGYGVTNSDGVAHLDHDADGEPIDHSYTGVGAGEIDVLASLDNPIIEGSIVSGTYEVIDCAYYETIPNGSLSHGTLTNGGSVSNDWSSIGEYSIKADLSSVNWVGYRINNPTVEKTGKVTLDLNNTNTRSTINVHITIDGTDRYVQQIVETGEQTVTIDYDFSQYEGTISRFEVRVVKYSSYTNPVYIDNIKIYPI